MSVIVKGMKIPTSCPECPLADSVVHCPLTGKTYNWGLIKRASNCPLIEVPTPHGRLIDADALIKQVKRDGIQSDPFVRIVCDYFKDAPTIIGEEI